MTGNRGSLCRNCGKTEQECAFSYPCCATQSGLCSHFRHLDSAGNDKPKPVPNVIRIDNRRACDTCGRRVSPRGRFDCPGLCASLRRAYDRDRWQKRVS